MVAVAVSVVDLPGPTADWVDARLRPIQPTETVFEVSAPLVGALMDGAARYATKLWTPALAEYATAHWPPCEQEPTSVPVVVSKIWIALPVPVTPAPAVAVSKTLSPAWIALVLEASVSCWTEAAGRRVKIGTLGATDGVSAGAPELLLEFEPPDRSVSVQAAGVLNAVSEPAGHAVCPSGVDATPGARSPPALVTHDAPSPEPGHGCPPSGRLSCKPSPATGEQESPPSAVPEHTVIVD